MTDNFVLRKGDRIIFLGDSITEQQLYTNYVEAYLASRYPELKLTFFNAGWGGDTAPGGCNRLDRDVLALKPDVVTICYGMNDGGYCPMKPEIRDAFVGGCGGGGGGSRVLAGGTGTVGEGYNGGASSSTNTLPTGGGSGGGYGIANTGKGGSGTVIVRYVIAAAPSTPEAPTGLTATAVATNRIELAWSDNATNETGFVVNRSLDSNAWILVTLTAANATNYSDTGLATNTLYYYRVAASNAAGRSAYGYASARTWTVYEQWQRLYFDLAGLNNLSISGAMADPDHDGLNNEQEYWAGTIPTNAASCLVLYSFTNNPVAPGEYVVRWQSVAGKHYAVQATTNLLVGFSDLRTNILATPVVNVHTDNVNGAGQKFYRVVVE